MGRQKALYLINVVLFVFAFIVAITGIIKFPGLLPRLNIDPYSLPLDSFTLLHDWLGLAVVVLALVHVLMHTRWIIKMTSNLWRTHRSELALIPLLLIIPISLILMSSTRWLPVALEAEHPIGEVSSQDDQKKVDDNDVLDKTLPVEDGQISIQGIGNFQFNPEEISAARDEIFNSGYFSLFDILVHLDQNGQIEMDYYFDVNLDTHVIESINGMRNWWYVAYYDAGWPERNAWRMDLYPYKDRTTTRIIQVDDSLLKTIYDSFTEETIRLKSHSGEIIIPEVIIRGQSFSDVFSDVQINAHNLRNDYFSTGTITAIDVILSLSEMGLITHQLNWYESIGSAGLVKNYFVDAINEDVAIGRCGFVYEAGSLDFSGFTGNHIHIPADLRVLTSPAYVEFFWICI